MDSASVFCRTLSSFCNLPEEIVQSLININITKYNVPTRKLKDVATSFNTQSTNCLYVLTA